MTTTRIIAATALTAILSLHDVGAAHAADITLDTMKPMQGLSFDVGTRHAVSYFLSDNEQCKLVLTIAEAPNFDDVASFSATRFEAAIPAGKATRYRAPDNKSLDFVCEAGAQAMTVKAVEQLAAGPGR